MHNTPPLPKLSARLAAIEALVTLDYDHIWDCCCDHGQLGMHIMAKGLAPNIHFVDLVPDLIENVRSKLTLHFPTQSQASSTPHWHTHCLDVANLPIKTMAPNAYHLVIIAGVGGDLCKELVTSLSDKNPKAKIDFLLCPVRHLYALRSELKYRNFEAVNETLVEENKRIYEVILTRAPRNIRNLEVTPTVIHELGDQIWMQKTRTNNASPSIEAAEQNKALIKRYLAQQVAHYQRKIDNKYPQNETILAKLNSLLETLA